MCETLNLKADEEASNSNARPASPRHESWDKVQDAWEQDCLVLVGTLYSLPLHHVRFEHERIIDVQQQPPKQADPNQPPSTSKESSDTTPVNGASSQSSSAVGTTARTTPIISRSDPPFHVIKSLSSTDNPIHVRNAMIEHLKRILAQGTAAALVSSNPSKPASSIAPKLQWYFVPGMNHPSSPIPSYIDLDGYTTSMEDEDDDIEEDPSNNNNNNNGNDAGDNQHDAEHDFDPDEILRRLPLSLQETCVTEDSHNNKNEESNHSEKNNMLSTKERIFKRERQGYYELSLCQSTLQHDCVSGFLLTESMGDPHVWKRVHCVLTDDHLWFISRVYTRPDDNDDFDEDENSKEQENDDKTVAKGNGEQAQKSPTTQPSYYSYARHRCLELTRALLLQPSKEKPTAPLFRTPFAFELVDSSGMAHRFRASNADVYKRWVAALSSRIVQSYENSLFDFAQLIVRDETEARNKRFMAVAVEPLWEKQQASLETMVPRDNKPKIYVNDDRRHVAMDSPTMTILRFGMEVTEFRERCRHIQVSLPARHPVFAMTKVTTEIVRSKSLNGSSENGPSGKSALPSIPTEGTIRLDLKTQALIKSAWDEAIRLGSRATKITVKLQVAAPSENATKMPRSLETICQHLEYVITGSFRGSSPRSAQGRSDNTRQFPPPIDMFDALLAELQTIAAASSAKHTAAAASTSQAGSLTNGKQ